jgi:transcriptional regulator with XRE-family HTH domain
MFKNKHANGNLNICGQQLKILRKNKKLSQRALADGLQLMGLDIGKNAIQQIESGERFVTDIELRFFAAYFDISTDDLVLR